MGPTSGATESLLYNVNLLGELTESVRFREPIDSKNYRLTGSRDLTQMRTVDGIGLK